MIDVWFVMPVAHTPYLVTYKTLYDFNKHNLHT